MIVKGIIDEDFVNYKKCSMVLIFPYCDFKCDRENGKVLCQNHGVDTLPEVSVPVDMLIDRYLHNKLSKAIIFQGLEPFCSTDDVIEFISKFRKVSDDDIVIYTGYNKDEIELQVNAIAANYKNIIIKYGRFRPDQKSHYDEVLGVNLASDNQYAERIS